MKSLFIVAALALVAAVPAARQAAPGQTFAPDAEGFIRNWLVLAPIAIDGESGATEILKDFLQGETKVMPSPNEKVGIGGVDMVWKPHQATDYYIDFLEGFGKALGEYVVGYAVAYVHADEEMKVTLALSTNDQGKAWLNGKQLLEFTETRTLEKDADRFDVTLVKGRNMLMLKVLNETNNWQGCARFLKGTVPVKNLRVSLVP